MNFISITSLGDTNKLLDFRKPSFDGTDKWQPTGYTELTYLNITGPGDMKLQKVKNLTPSEFWSKLGLLENENLVFVREEL